VIVTVIVNVIVNMIVNVNISVKGNVIVTVTVNVNVSFGARSNEDLHNLSLKPFRLISLIINQSIIV